MTLSERSLGWLRYLDRKVHTKDDWSRTGKPHAHWDDRSNAPMADQYRFDLVGSSYAMGLMAHRTPAWTEPYVAILDQLIERHTGWWSAPDWLTQSGDEPRGGQTDPIAADGMASYQGFLLVLLGIRSMIAGEKNDRWNTPFELIKDGPKNTFEWTHSRIAANLNSQWKAAPLGPHCENTSIWPARLAGAGLGLRLHDNRHGTNFHAESFDPWWASARERYLELAAGTPPETTTLSYDPVADVHHRVLAQANLTTAFYAASQKPDDAQLLFAGACQAAGLLGDMPVPLQPDGGFAAALLLAREWGMSDLEARLVEAIEASYEPTWDSERGEFTWGMGLNEQHPRGQHNALLAAAEANGEGAWTALSAAPLDACPQVVEVDFPDVAMTRAEWIAGNLYLKVAVRKEDPSRRTSFRIVGAEPRLWDIHAPERTFIDVKMSGIHITMPMVNGAVELFRGSY